jgi:putative intracellular protease/amidase
MRRRTLAIGLTAVALVAAALPVLLAPRGEPAATPAPPQVPPEEYRQAVEALKPPKRQRPVVAIVALNAGTEVSDLLTTYGVLAQSGLVDLAVVAESVEPIRLYYTRIGVEPQATMARFDAAYPEGADYVVVPAMDPTDNPVVVGWIKEQHAKGAKIVSVCNGSATLGAAGLLDGHRATGHWYFIEGLREKYPTMEWVRDRRYVVDRGIATSTGVTASVPLMMALVEAIGGRAEAERLAARLGVAEWDARHASAAFRLTLEHRKTFVRNTLAFWRHEDVGIVVDGGVDEIALGLIADAYARTELAEVTAVGGIDGAVRSRRGLRLRPHSTAASADVDTLVRLLSDAPARALDRELPRIAARYDDPTAAIVALTMEYPWSGPPARN